MHETEAGIRPRLTGSKAFASSPSRVRTLNNRCVLTDEIGLTGQERLVFSSIDLGRALLRTRCAGPGGSDMTKPAGFASCRLALKCETSAHLSIEGGGIEQRVTFQRQGATGKDRPRPPACPTLASSRIPDFLTPRNLFLGNPSHSTRDRCILIVCDYQEP